SSQNKLINIFHALIQEPDLEWEFIDGTFVKAHQHSAGAASHASQAIGQSKGGKNTKIHMAVDACGRPIAFKLTGGEVHDSAMAPELLEIIPQANFIIADRGYDSESIR